MRDRLARVVAVGLGLGLMSLSPVGVVAGAAPESDVSVAPAGPLDRPLGAWVAEYASVFDEGTQIEDLCALGDRDEVFFLPPTRTDCTVRADQHILVSIVSRRCGIPTRLIERAERDQRPRARAERTRDQEAVAFRCLHAPTQLLAGPHLAVDAEIIPVDETFRVTTPPLSEDERTTWEVGDYAVLEPLPVGSHTIVRGHSAFPDSPLRVASTIEVAAASE